MVKLSFCKKSTNNLGRLILFFIIVLSLVFLAAFPFLGNSPLLFLIISAITAVICSFRLRVFLQNKKRSSFDLQLLWLLEVISADLNAGNTLEESLIKAKDELEKTPGMHRHLYKALTKLKNCLLAHIDLDKALFLFREQFKSCSADQILRIIPDLRIYGGQLDIYIQDSYQMLHQKITIKKEVIAEQSAKVTEMFILCITPFALAYVLNFTGNHYKNDLVNASWGTGMQLLLFLLSVSAVFISLAIYSSSNIESKAIKSSKLDDFILFSPFKYTCKKQKEKIRGEFISKVKSLHCKIMPAAIRLKIYQQISKEAILANIDENKAVDCFISAKIRLFAIIFTIFLPVLFLLSEALKILPFILFFSLIWHDLFVLNRYKIRKMQENIQFPAWINLLSVLLSSGLTLQKSFIASCNSFTEPNNSQGGESSNRQYDYFREEIAGACRHIENGCSETSILEKLSDCSTLLQSKTALHLIMRYNKDGGRELLHIIRLQSNACWQIYKNQIKKNMQAKSNLYLIPMGIDLIAILGIAILPAIATLQIY